jgi:RNA polymerase sigma-70 factor (ECF subfamily)
VDTVSSLALSGTVASAQAEPLFGLLAIVGGAGGGKSDGSTTGGASSRRQAIVPEPPPSEVRPTRRSSTRSSSAMKPTDRDLVDRARSGDSGAFGELVKRHQQRIHRLAVHMLRDRAEAEDVTQETFIRAYRALARFDGRSEPYTWFYRITINLSLNRIRSRKTARTSHDTDDPRLDGVLIDKKPETSDPQTSAQRHQLYETLTKGIDGLSDTLRTTLVLVCIDGRSHEEVAAILGAPEGTIAWRIHEARRKLKEFMQARGFDPEGDGT